MPSLRSVVLEYYTQVNPERVRDVDALVAHFAGREAEMARQMQAKYGVGLWDVASARAREARDRAEVAEVLSRLVGEVMSRSRDARRSKQAGSRLCDDEDEDDGAVDDDDDDDEEGEEP